MFEGNLRVFSWPR